jgi:hypothetical protein
MAFTVPIFNIFCDVWNSGHTPFADAPDAENVPCQFYVNSRGTFDVQPCEIEVYTPPLWVRLPIDQIGVWASGQIFEVASESGRYYRARFKDRMHYGFPNQYLFVVVVQCTNEGIPLIRDIEGAEPCTDVGPVHGGGESTVSIDSGAEGEGTVSAPPVEPHGVGDDVWFVAPIGEGTGTVT